MKPPRVVHFLDCTGHGGDALAALSLASEQRSLGIDARIVAVNGAYAGLFEIRALDRGVPTTVAAALEHHGGQSTAARARATWSALRRHGGHVLHMHTGRLFIRTADVLAVRALPYRCVLATIQSPFTWETTEDGDVQRRRWRHASSWLDAVVTPSRAAMAVQSAAGVERLHTVHNPVDAKLIDDGDGTLLRRELRLPTDSVIVLFVARLDREKSPLEVVAAFADLAADHPGAHLVVAGTGALEDACADLVRQRRLEAQVHLLGHRTDVADLLQAADVFVHPSLHESFGISIVEAMAAGLPVVTTRVGVVPEIPSHESTLRLVEAHDVGSIETELRALIGSPEACRAYGSRAAEAASRFATHRIATEYVDLYRRVGSRPKRWRQGFLRPPAVEVNRSG